MARLEYKYYIPNHYQDELRRDVMPFLKYDPFALKMPKKEYVVKSVYLDSPQMHTYHEKLIGIKERCKFRVRGYNDLTDDSIVFLEIKRKNLDYITKDRAKLKFNNLKEFIQTSDFNLLAGSTPVISNKYRNSARNFLYYYHLYQLKPVVNVVYNREAFECKFGTDIRITFDKNIRTRKVSSFTDVFSHEEMKTSLRNYFVLEVK